MAKRFRLKALIIPGLIPWSLQLQAQVKLASLVWSPKSGMCAKSVRVKRCVSAVGAMEVLVFVCLHSSCNHVTDVEGTKFCETRAESCHAKWWGLCEYNPATLYLSISCPKLTAFCDVTSCSSSPNRQYLSIKLHSLTYHKTVIFKVNRREKPQIWQ